VRIEFERIEPVFNALPDGVGGGCLDAGLDLLVQFLELVLDLGLSLPAYVPSQALAAIAVAERDGAGVALVVWVPRTSSASCDQAVFVDHAADASVSPDVVSLNIDRFG
jgi:hypothetical protein